MVFRRTYEKKKQAPRFYFALFCSFIAHIIFLALAVSVKIPLARQDLIVELYPTTPPVATKPTTPPVATKPTTPPVATKPTTPPVATKPTTPPVATSTENLDNEAIKSVEEILQTDNETKTLGKALIDLRNMKRTWRVPPDFSFLESEVYTANSKNITIRVQILPDGTISQALVMPPGSGNIILDRKIKLAIEQALFNDVSMQRKIVEIGMILCKMDG